MRQTRWLNVLTISCLAAAGVAALDALLQGAAPAGFVRATGITLAHKAQALAVGFLPVFLLLAVCGGMLTSGIRALQILGGVFMGAGMAFYAVSWAVFFRVNEFLGVEGMRFVFYNFTQLMEHVAQTSRISVVVLFFLSLVLPAIAVPACARVMIHVMALLDRRSRTFYRISLAASGTIVMAMMLLVSAGAGDPSVGELARTRLSPQATVISELVASAATAGPSAQDQRLLLRWNRQVSMPAFTAKAGAGVIKPPVIVIAVESMRNDVLDDDRVMPNVFQLKKDSLFFRNTFPPSNETDYAWPAILSSQYPLRSALHHYYPPNITYPRVFIYDVLKAQGYATALFSAQNEQWGSMRNYLATNGLDVLFDANVDPASTYFDPHDQGLGKWAARLGMAGKIDDARVLDQALHWAGGMDGRPFFLALNLQRSHFPYTWPDTFSPPFSPAALDFEAFFGRYPLDKIPLLKNRYYNALAYVDQQIGRLVGFLKERGIYDKALIVVLGDHGESFYEQGVSCHAGSLDRASTRTLMLVKTPGNSPAGEKPAYAETIDVPPTICRLLGLPPHPAFQGHDVLGPSSTHRPVFMTVNTVLANQDAVLFGKWKFIRDYKSGREQLFDVENDPREQRDARTDFPDTANALRAQLMAWRSVQLDYYADRGKQQVYYPPEVVFGSAP